MVSMLDGVHVYRIYLYYVGYINNIKCFRAWGDGRSTQRNKDAVSQPTRGINQRAAPYPVASDSSA